MYIYGHSPIIGSDDKFHYVYRITNIVENKHYYGSRTSKINPYDDLGKKYFSSASSPKNSWIKKDQKKNPQNYKYKILRTFATRIKATAFECLIHEKFNVDNSENFYNLVRQTSSKFHTENKVTVIDENGNIILISCDNPKYLSGKYVSVMKGRVHVSDSDGKLYIVYKNDHRIKTGQLVKVSTITVKDDNGNTFRTTTNDEKYLSGELKPIATNRVAVKDSLGNCYSVFKDDPLYLDGTLQFINVGKLLTIDNSGKYHFVHKSDPRLISKELSITSISGTNHGSFRYYRKTPWGIFTNRSALEPEISARALDYWCGSKNNKKMTKITYDRCKKLRNTFGTECIGKTFKELGFSNLTPEEYQQLTI